MGMRCGMVVWVALCVALCAVGCDLGGGDGGCGECALLTVCNDNTGECVAPDDYPGVQVNRVPSLALDTEGRLLVAAQSLGGGRRGAGRRWVAEARFRYQLVDSRGEVGGELALALGPDGHPGILYYDANQLLLRYAFYSADTRRWLTEEVDSSSANLGTSQTSSSTPTASPTPSTATRTTGRCATPCVLKESGASSTSITAKTAR